MTTEARDKRASWDQYFMGMAAHAATRATCDRKHVGAVIVRDKTVLSTGYNGSVRGHDHCDDVGHLMEEGHCVRTVHAEANAIIQAAKNGTGIDGATLYTTASPCWACFRIIVNSGIKRIVYGEFYNDERSIEVADDINLELVDLSASLLDEDATDARARMHDTPQQEETMSYEFQKLAGAMCRHDPDSDDQADLDVAKAANALKSLARAAVREKELYDLGWDAALEVARRELALETSA